jgi:hypothetical protein
MNKKLFEKSLNSRNERAYKELVDREALVEWTKRPSVELPKFVPVVARKNVVGWSNFVSIVMALRP